MDGSALRPVQATPRHTVAQVFAAAWHAQRRRGAVWPWVLLVLAAASLLPIQLLLPAGSARVLRGLATVLLSSLAIGLWLVFVFNVLQQNHPQWARLVPGHVTALRRALSIGAALVASCAAVLAAWAGWPWPVAALIVAALCAAVASALRWPTLWLLVAAAGFTLPWQREAGVLQWVAQAWHQWPAALASAVLVGTALALRAVVFTGQPGHALAQAKLALSAALARGETPSVAQRAFSVGWLGPTRWAEWAYAASMQRLLARPRPPVNARLALGIGPQAHWSGVFASTLYVLVVFAMVLGLRHLLPQWRVVEASYSGLLIGVALVGMIVPLQLPTALWSTRREQALLMLLPGVPRGARLNRWLALRIAALDIAVLLALLGAVAFFGHVGPADPLSTRVNAVVLGALVLGLLVTPALWRNWARARAPSGLLQWGMIGACMLAGGLSAAWVHGLGRSWHGLIAWTVLLGAPLALWRWRRLQTLPSAWPVGRAGMQAPRSPRSAA